MAFRTLQQNSFRPITESPSDVLSNVIRPKKDLLQRTGDIVNKIFPGQKVGEAIGTLAGYALSKNKEQYDLSAPSPLEVIGDVASGASLVGGLKLPVPSSLGGAVGQYGGLSALGGAGGTLAEGGSVEEATKEGVISGAIGGVTGGVFNLLGKGLSKLAEKTVPSTLSFTSGVPKTAIEQAIAKPEITKQGVNMSVPEIRTKAVTSLNSLYDDLGKEFSEGLKTIKSTVPDLTKSIGDEAPNAIPELKSKLVNIGKNLARDYRVSFAKGAVDFSKSNIVNASEQKNVVDAIKTLQSWKDFSPQGVQDLAERVGALRKFESGATTKASAVVGQIYNNIAGEKGIIATLYPELKELRTNFATNRKILDEINNVLSADKTKPVAVQGAVSRLDNMFTQNKDAYINAVRQLGERSGVDFLSLLAGGEFQKVLPDFIRGLGGASAVSVGASLLNPWLVLLAPLFSPRAVGSIVRNAPSVAKTTSQVLQSGATQAIPQLRK